LSAAGGITIGPLGTVRGDGAIVANVNNTGGLIAPGTSSGTLHVTGNYTQSTSLATLQIELSSATSFDKLAVTGNMMLGGVLDVRLTGGYVPYGQRSFDILDWGGSLTGEFEAIVLPALGGTLVWDTSQLYTTGVLSVVGPNLAGDFNGDGFNNAADYVVWRKGLGTTYTQNDYDLWRAHFGQAAGSGSGATASAAVPEPATLVLLLVGMAVLSTYQYAAVS
jgi:hypothetical protein